MSIEDALTNEQKLFKHYFNGNVNLYDALQSKEGQLSLKDKSNQWALDSFDHLQRVLTKGNISKEDHIFCADVVLKMFKIPGLKEEVFDEIEEIIGSEHFVNDLIDYNKELRNLIANL